MTQQAMSHTPASGQVTSCSPSKFTCPDPSPNPSSSSYVSGTLATCPLHCSHPQVCWGMCACGRSQDVELDKPPLVSKAALLEALNTLRTSLGPVCRSVAHSPR